MKIHLPFERYAMHISMSISKNPSIEIVWSIQTMSVLKERWTLFLIPSTPFGHTKTITVLILGVTIARPFKAYYMILVQRLVKFNVQKSIVFKQISNSQIHVVGIPM